MCNQKLVRLVFPIAFLLAAMASSGGSFTNGSFEVPAIAGAAQGLNPGDTWLTGWTVGGPGYNMGLYRGSTGGISPYDGQQWVYFGGDSAPAGGTLSQTVTTVAGTSYTVTYYAVQAGSPASLALSAAAFNTGGSLLSSNRCVPVNVVWNQYQLSFTATSTSTTLSFIDTSAVDIPGSSIALDDVTVMAQPTTGIPVIVTSPVSQTAPVGASVSFSATASGSPSTIQWYVGTNLVAPPNGTSSPLVVAASDSTAGNYTAVFSNSYGMATSAVAVLTVTNAPILANGSFEIPVISGVAQGLNPGDTWLTDWTVGGPGGNMGLYRGSTGGISPYDGQQWVYFGGVSTASGGTLSQTFTTVAGTSYVVTYYAVQAGSPASLALSAVAFNAGGSLLSSNRCVPLNVVWNQYQLSFTATSDSTTLSFIDTSSVDIAGSSVVVDDVSVAAGSYSPPTPPTVTVEPLSQSVANGSQVTFTAAANGGSTSVQWYFCNYLGTNAISGANATNLAVIASGATAGSYFAVFNNTAGSTTTDAANLGVTGLTFGNGSFEIPVEPSGGTGLNPGDTWLTDWTVGGPGGNMGLYHGSVPQIGPYNGQQWVYFGGINTASGGTLAQTFTTVVGDFYTVTYYVGTGALGSLSLTGEALDAVGNVLATNRFVPVHDTWIQCQLLFVCQTTNTTLVFKDTSAADIAGTSITLDDVTVVGAPNTGIPVVVVSPTSQTVATGADVLFSATAAGGPSTIQWYLGTNVVTAPPGTNSPLEVTASDSTAGDYTAVFSNSYGTATSAVAVLTVTNVPILINGSFEVPVEGNGGTGLNPGNTFLTGWTIAGPGGNMGLYHGSVSEISPYDGQQWAYFGGGNSVSGGALSQTFSTVAGMAYVATFYLDQGGAVANMSMSATASSVGGSLLNSNRYVPANSVWTQYQLAFTAVSASTTLSFIDTSPQDVSGANIALDYVSVTAEPETGSPVIVTSPFSQSMASGTIVSFNATAAGSPSFLQWYFGTNAVAAPAGTNAPLVITANDGAAGGYTAVFSNSYGTATSAVAVLTVVDPPVVTVSPASQAVAVASQVTLSAAASGGASTVQWWYNGTNAISGATSTNLSFLALPGTAGNYSAVFNNLAGSATSMVATVTVVAGPLVNGGFESINNHAAIPPGTGSVILPGATWLTGWTVGGPGYDIFVYDGTAGGFGPVDGQHWINFNGENTAPGGILSQTFLTTVGAPYSVSFSVGKAGTGNVSLTATVVSTNNTIIASNHCVPTTGVWTQFHLNFTATTTNSTLIFTDTSTQTIGVDVTLDAVSVVTPPVVTLSPASQEVLVGSAVTFTAAATNGPTGVQWFQGTNAILNATSTTLSFTANAGSGGNYTAVFTNVAGSATTAVAVLTVDLPAGLALQPQSIVTNVGATVTLTGAANGSAPLGLQWTFDGTNIIGANSTSLVITNAQPSNAGSYALVVTNAYGTNTSTNATLSFISTLQVGSATELGAGSGVTTLTNPVTTIPVTVPVNLLAVGNENALGFNINYDASHLTYVGATIGSGAVGGAFGVNSSQAGKVGVAVILPEGTTFATGTQQVVQVTFQASLVSTPTTTPITFGNIPTPPGISDTNAVSISPVAYLGGTVSILPTGLEGDVSPLSGEDYAVTINDWVQEGRFLAGVDVITNAAEFQRADCAPRATLGDGYITIEDWIQVGRYYLGLDTPTLQGGPTNAPLIGDLAPKRGGNKFAPDGGTATVLTLTPTTQGATSTSVTVQMAAQGDEGGVAFSVNFDPTALRFNNATAGSAATGASLNVGTNNLAAGNVGIALAFFPPQTFAAGTLNIVTLNFNSISYSNNVALSFGNTPTRQGVSDSLANPLPASYQNAAIQVGGQAWPHLAISQSGSGISFSWPSSATALKAQWTTNLGTNWTDVVATAVTNGGTVYLTLPPPSTTTFYRLSQ